MSFASNHAVELYGDGSDDEEKRIFDPRTSPAHYRMSTDQLIVYTSAKKIRQLKWVNTVMRQISVDRHTVVVSIDGACRGNGTPSARASWGVYFGPQSPHNASGLLDHDLPQTSTRAEIEALSQALRIICGISSNDFSLQKYYIITDSSYLVKTFSEWIYQWIRNGGEGYKKGPVAHFETIKDIHTRLDEMTYGDDGGMSFKFWQVSREENKEADALANEALDGEHLSSR